jgi:hypothetical protein
MADMPPLSTNTTLPMNLRPSHLLPPSSFAVLMVNGSDV